MNQLTHAAALQRLTAAATAALEMFGELLRTHAGDDDQAETIGQVSAALGAAIEQAGSASAAPGFVLIDCELLGTLCEASDYAAEDRGSDVRSLRKDGEDGHAKEADEDSQAWGAACDKARALLAGAGQLEDAAKPEAAPVPLVVVNLNGGVIEDVRSTIPVRVLLLDEDTEGADADRCAEVEGVECYVSDWTINADTAAAEGPDVLQAVAEVDAADLA